MASDDEIERCCCWGCVWFPQARVGAMPAVGYRPAPKLAVCWRRFCFSPGPPLGTGCSIDKSERTKISWQTNSVYPGSFRKYCGWKPQLAQSTIPCLVGRKVWCSRTRTHARAHTCTTPLHPTTCIHLRRYLLVRECAPTPPHVNVHPHTHNCTGRCLGDPRLRPMLTLTYLCP